MSQNLKRRVLIISRRIKSIETVFSTFPLFFSAILLQSDPINVRDIVLVLLIYIVSRSDPKEMQDVREREERGVDGFEDKEREGCHHSVHVREREVSGFEDSFNCCRVLEGERPEREREIINVRVDRSFLLVLVVCVAHDLAHVSLF